MIACMSIPSAFPSDVIPLLQAMVRFDTVNSHTSGVPHAEEKLAEYLEGLAELLDLKTRKLPYGDGEYNLLITYEAGDDKPWLMFESHMDVVGVDGMTIEPFNAAIRDGKVWGRGACDTKGTGAAMFFALKNYMEQEDQPNNIALLFVGDEEVSKTGAIAFARDHLPTLPFRPEGVIVGEPTMLQPIIAHNGVTRLMVSTSGIACHSSNPANGSSAIKPMMKVIDAIERDYIPSLTTVHPLTGKAQSSINIIRAGKQFNIIPDYCEIGIDRRVVPGEKPEDIVPALEKVLAPLKEEMPEADITIHPILLDPSLSPREGAFHDFVNGVLSQFGDVNPQGVPYGTDASNYDDVGLPAIVLGPGHIAQAHTKDEWVEIEQIEKGVEVYGALMRTGYAAG